MAAILFHCTFSDRDMTGYIHTYEDSWKKLPYVYVACIAIKNHNVTTVIGGAVIQTDIHHRDDNFISTLAHSLIQCPEFQHYRSIPFTLQPFQISRLASEFPISTQDYYEILFDKYLELTHSNQLPS